MKKAGLYCATVELQLEAPFLFRGLGTRAFGIDAAQIRDGLGRPIIPMTEIRGLMRHASDLVHDPDWVLEKFGNRPDDPAESPASKNRRSARASGRLIFSDLAMNAETDPEIDPEIVTRIAIDRMTGAVEDGMMVRSELVAPIGKLCDFAGTVHFVAMDTDEAATVVEQLKMAIRLIRSAGAAKTAGFGRVSEAEISDLRLVQGFALTPKVPKDTTQIVFGLDRPLLVDADQTAPNSTKGRSVIPGAVLKGALATKLDFAGLLDDAMSAVLSTVVIGPAFPIDPVEDGRRLDPILPVSLLAFEEGGERRFVDAAEDGGWQRALDIAGSNGTLSFADGWKPSHWRAFDERFGGRPETETITRTRVGINAERGAAEKGALFTETMTSHLRQGRQILWSARIHWPDGSAATPEAAIIEAALSDGLFFVGNTAAVTTPKPVSVPVISPTVPSGRVRIMLESPHLMLRVGDLVNATTFREAVNRWFETHGAGHLSLVEDGIFATQSLAGGWQMKSFETFGTGIMEPYVLMNPGSVFVVDADAAGSALLAEWTRAGLPAGCNWSDATLDWQHCPYLPENGYGAICLNPSLTGVSS